MNIQEVQVSDIQIGERHRKDLGDLEGLARSIEVDELFQPIGLTPQNELIFGLRRLTACRDILGWTTIPARIIDVASIAHGEYVENAFRKDLTISERVALADALRSFSHGGDRRSDQVLSGEDETLTVDEAAKRAGLGGKDDYYRFMKAKMKGVPELMEAIDAGKLSVSLAANIAELPPEDQQESVRRGKLVEKRDSHDFYPTPRGVTEALLQHEQFSASVYEPACGDGAISDVLKEAGYSVDSCDLIDRGYGDVDDFLTTDRRAENIITNPPFEKAEEFVRKALSSTTGKVAMFLPLTFLESRKRESLLADSCLKTVYVFVDRVSLYKGGSARCGGGRAAYAWFVWEHGYDGPPTLGWVHSERKGVILGPLPDCDGTAPITLDLHATGMSVTRNQEPVRDTAFTCTEVGNVQVWCGDSLSLIQNHIVPKSVDVAVTSPPYNTGMKYGEYDDNRPVGEYLDWLDKVFAAIRGVLKDEGSFFLNIGSKPTDPKRARLVTEIAERHFVVQNDIKWIKAISIGDDSFGHFTPLNSQRYLNHNWENVLHLTKTGDMRMDRLAVGVSYMDKNNIIRSRSKNTRRCRGDVWFIPHETVQSQRDRWDHPCPFPVTLAEWCIRLHGRTDDMLVLDPFNGVGSSTVAMTRVGVSGIGIDIDPGYCKAAVNRIEDELAPELIICIEDCYSMRERPIPESDLAGWEKNEKLPPGTATRLLERIPEEVRRLVDNGPSSAA